MIEKFDWQGDALYVALKGEVTYNELNNIRERIWGDSRFDNLKYGIYNMLNVSLIDISSMGIHEISVLDKSASRWNDSVKIAFVVNNKSVENTIQEYIKEMKKLNWEINIFKVYNEALDWCRI